MKRSIKIKKIYNWLIKETYFLQIFLHKSFLDLRFDIFIWDIHFYLLSTKVWPEAFPALTEG